MIRKSLAHSCAICEECQAMMVYRPASEGMPHQCQRCGVPANVELTPEQRAQMERMQQQQAPRGFTINM